MRRLLGILLVFVPLAGAVRAAPPENWVGAWAAAQQIPEPNNALPPERLKNATLRQIVRLSLGGPAIRVRVSNAFGTEPLHLLALHVAHAISPDSSRIDPASDRAVQFNARQDVVIPAGAEYLSDPLSYPVPAFSDLAITMQIEAMPGQQTGHPGSRATSYLAEGLPASAAELKPAQTVEHWFFLSGIDVAADRKAAAIVVLGDSITDGHGATTNGNDRWTDVLAQRLRHSSTHASVSVLNAGLGGNRLLLDGLGPNALARLDRDVIAPSGVRYLIVLEGVNDLGTLTRTAPATAAQHEDLVRRMIGAYRQIVLRAHAHGIKVFGATIMPFAGSDYYHPNDANEHDRQVINAWIRSHGNFDAVIDFDKIVADPEHPEHLRGAYDLGDHLHTSPAGFRAMAEGIPLDLFKN